MMEAFTEAESKEFIRLLKKIQENGYWTPHEVWLETLRTFARYAFELVIIDHKNEIPRILMTRYTGNTMPAHKGRFHIPGGFALLKESVEETCSRIARGELGVDVKFQGLLGIHKWSLNESPSGALPLSIYSSCKPFNKIALSESCRFFTREEMLALSATDMVAFHPHRAFVDRYLQQLESNHAVSLSNV